MLDSILQENLIRSYIFISSLIILLIVGIIFSYRKYNNFSARMYTNIFLGFINSIFIKILIPISLVQLANLSVKSNWGLINNVSFLSFQNILVVISSILLLDMLIYWQHRLTHKIPILWKLHRVHHTDLHIDTTSGVRFHPLEIMMSYVIKVGLIIAIGIPPLAVLIFEIILSTSSLFNHSNFTLPKKVERLIRFMIVTPDMHRIHHSVIVSETNSNYSFSFSFWDKLFGSYVDKPKGDPKVMDLGLSEFRDQKKLSIFSLLIQPFK